MDAKDQILTAIAASDLRGRPLRQQAMELLSTLADYEWCGIYTLAGDMLELDAYVGDHTDHTQIPVGRGVCGTAVAEDRNQVIADVRALDNYLACSLKTRSEIVVLIRRGDQILGQIDIDGHVVGTFGPEDEAFLEKLASQLAERWEA